MSSTANMAQTFSLATEECAPCQLATGEADGGQFAVLDAPTERAEWAGVIGMEGSLTGDGRLIEADALRWEVSAEHPLPIRYVAEDNGAHDGAVVAGRILGIERREGGVIWAHGDFDLGSEAGREARRVVAERLQNGVSMDLDDVSFEVRIAADLLAEMMGEGGEVEPDADGRVKVMEMDSDDEIRVTTDARIRAATLVAIPAFAEAFIEVLESSEDGGGGEEVGEEPDEGEDAAALVASAGPVAPPRAWFEDPELTEPTPLTITDDGYVYGHLALWGTCHTSHTSQGQCITPPSSASGYVGFRTGSVRTAEGHEVPVGRITMGTKHAGLRLNAAAAAQHYDNTGSAVADVAAGEDAHGIWIAGAMRPSVTPEQVRALRASPLSGDWREQGRTGSMELVAVLAVNVPGFPVPRPAGNARDGRVRALVASGMLPPRRVRPPGAPDALSKEDLRYLKALAKRERAAARTRVDAMARERRRETLLAKVRAFADARN